MPCLKYDFENYLLSANFFDFTNFRSSILFFSVKKGVEGEHYIDFVSTVFDGELHLTHLDFKEALG